MDINRRVLRPQDAHDAPPMLTTITTRFDDVELDAYVIWAVARQYRQERNGVADSEQIEHDLSASPPPERVEELTGIHSLLKGRGRGRVVTQRCFGPTRSLAAPSAATFKVAASGAAHERLSPTSGRAARVVRMGQERGVRGGQGRRGEPRRRCEVAGRAQAGGTNT